MPISKSTGNAYCTDAQVQYAKYETSALEYAKQQGYPLIKKGAYYVHADHDSLVFAPNGTWYWNSRDMHGNAIDFITQYEHKTFIEAVLILNGERNQSLSTTKPGEAISNAPPAPSADYTKKEEEPKGEFILPEKAKNYSRLFGYICKGRMIDTKIAQALVKENKLYLSSQMSKNNHEINNVVFVSFDENNNPRSAYQRGTWTPENGKPFKLVVANGNKIYPFHMNGEGDTVIVFEASIDAMSHATMQLGKSQTEPHRIALGGTWGGPLFWFLQQHPEVQKITLALDNDTAGREATTNITAELQKQGYTTENITVITPQAKDWNDDLMNSLAQTTAQAQQPQGFEEASDLDCPF